MSLRTIIDNILEINPQYEKSSVNSAYDFLFKNNNIQKYDTSNSAWNLYDPIIVTTWKTLKSGLLSWRVDYSRDKNFRQAQARFANGQLNNVHSHNYVELTFVLKGRIIQIIEGKEVVFHANDVYFIDSHSHYCERLMTEDSEVLFLGVSNNFFHEIMFSSEHTSQKTQFLSALMFEKNKKYDYVSLHPKGNPAEINKLLENILLEATQRRVGSNYLLRGFTARLFILLTELYDFSINASEKKKLRNVIFKDVQNYLFKNYMNIHIDDLTNEFHYNKDYFNRLIKENTGKTYSEYVQEIRLAEAVNNLRQTSLPVEDIAHKVGYNNIGYFYKIFKENYGMTPADFRTKNR